VIVLIDTDILIDVALNRLPHANAAAELLDAVESRALTGFVAWHSIANSIIWFSPIAWVRRSQRLHPGAAAVCRGRRDLDRQRARAASLPMPDFEDALQAAAALTCGASVIATRNIRYYLRAPVRALTPAALLKELAR